MSDTRWQCTVCLTGFDEWPHVCDPAAAVQRLAGDLKASNADVRRLRQALENIRYRAKRADSTCIEGIEFIALDALARRASE